MVEIVATFAIMLAVFEFIILSMVPPRYRLRLLGNRAGCIIVHVCMLSLNLWVHWGTVTGTMSATGAFIVSIAVIEIAKLTYGTIVDDRRVRRGIIGYHNSELIL